MTHRKTIFGWALFVSTACTKSVLDIAYFRRDGTFDTITYGRQAFSSHPAWCCANILLDALAVWGAFSVTRKAVISRWGRT